MPRQRFYIEPGPMTSTEDRLMLERRYAAEVLPIPEPPPGLLSRLWRGLWTRDSRWEREKELRAASMAQQGIPLDIAREHVAWSSEPRRAMRRPDRII